MAILTKDQIQQIDDRPIEIINVPEWDKDGSGGQVRMRVPGASDRDQIEEIVSIASGNKRSHKGLRAKMVRMCIVNEDGSLMFTEGDIETLGKKSAKAIDRLFAIAMRLFGFSGKEMAKVRENLSEGQSDGSTSD